MRLYLCNVLAYWDKSWYTSSQDDLRVCVQFHYSTTYWSGDMQNRFFFFVWINSENFVQKNHKIGLFRCSAAYQVEQYRIFPCRTFWASCHIEFCHKTLYFTNTLAYYETRYVSSARCLEGTQKVSGQRHLVVKNGNSCWLILPIVRKRKNGIGAPLIARQGISRQLIRLYGWY